MKANEILRQAAETIEDRARLRDNADGERSMLRAVVAFNALKNDDVLTELDGWLFLSVLKMSRATAGRPHLDDYTDLAGYAALAAECVSDAIEREKIEGPAAGIDREPIPHWQNFCRDLPNRSEIPDNPAVNRLRCPENQVCDYCQLGIGKPCYES